MKSLSSLLLICLLLIVNLSCQSLERRSADSNKKLIERTFADWKNGKGSIFDLLDERVTWIVAGSSPVSGTYQNKQELMELLEQINNKLAGPVKPELKSAIAQDDVVVAIWQGDARRLDGKVYSNTYSWHMTMREGKIIRVTAFLDTYLLTELMKQY